MEGQGGAGHHIRAKGTRNKSVGSSDWLHCGGCSSTQPKIAQQLGRLRVQFPVSTVAQQNQLFCLFLWVNAAETPIHES